MKIPGSIYQDKKGNVYAALYNYWRDIYRTPPNNNYETVAHVSYQFAGSSRGIDIFLLKNKLHDVSKDIAIKRKIIEEKSMIQELPFIDSKHNIEAELVGGYDSQSIKNLYRQDIEKFCRKEAKQPGMNSTVYVHELVPITSLKTINTEKYLKDGKQEFIPSCILDTNLDFSWGCISGFVPSNRASFDGKKFTGYFLDLHAECNYCYAGYQHKSFAKYIVNIDKKKLIKELDEKKKALGREVVLRLGKRTESGSKFTRTQLFVTLEACLETGTRAVMPTKYLKFDRDIATLFRKTGSTLLYSIGYDKFERGAVLHGCNNEWRLEQAARYRKNGINSVIYLLVDLPNTMTEREHNILNFARENNLLVQLLAIRFPGKDVARKVVGASWEDLTMNENQLVLESINGKIHGGYKWKYNQLIAQRIHQDYSNLIENNNCGIRLCHHNDAFTYCGSCFLKKGFIAPTEHVEIVKKYKKIEWRKQEKERRRKKLTHQMFEKE